MDEAATSSKDPRKIARKYQIELCKKAIEENIIVYLGTGCGKTHIAVLLMYELAHLIRKPSKDVCVFLAPTVPLVRQQALVIENSTDFKVRCHHGNCKGLKDHHDWNMEIEQFEIFVMTPEIFLHILRHCFLRMDLISLLIFDECHHAQAQKRHPYAQIMKEFYKSDAPKRPRIFGMTASPIIGKGGSNVLNYTKCINSLEQLLDAKVCSVDNISELDSIVASPDVEFYFYGPKSFSKSHLVVKYSEKLCRLKMECSTMLVESSGDMNEYQKKMKSLSTLHENLVFCMEHIGLYGALHAARILLVSDKGDLSEYDSDNSNGQSGGRILYLNGAVSILSHDLVDDGESLDSLAPKTLEEPFFSQKLLCLIEILSRYRTQELTKCIIFVKRRIVARSLAYILDNLSSLKCWKCGFLVGCNSGSKIMSRQKMNAVTETFCNGKVNLLVTTSVAEEGLDIQTCCLVIRFDLPQTVTSFIQSRGRARMKKSKYIILLEKGNQHDEKLVEDFMSGESMMNREIGFRSSEGTFDTLEETIYKVDSTGASISTGCSISLLHRYCSNLPRDIYFKPSPNYYYMDDNRGIICRVVLPPNAALRQVDSEPCSSKDMAKRNACLKACQMLHELGALTDYLLPDVVSKRRRSSMNSSKSKSHGDDNLGEELHEMRVPALLKESWLSIFNRKVNLQSYYIRFLPIPDDRDYRMFGLFLMRQLPEEAELLEVDLHLAHGRIVKTGLNRLGLMSFDEEEMMIAQRFQEIFLKIIFNRIEFSSDQITLGEVASSIHHNSTSYLLLPLKQQNCSDNNNKLVIDWATMRHCLLSPIFGSANSLFWRSQITNENSVKMKDGEYRKCDVVGSLIYAPHNGIFFFVDSILHEVNATSQLTSQLTYAEHFKDRFNIELSHPDQPLLKVKQLFNVHNLLLNRIVENTEAKELNEHFVELPPELCCVKILGFSKEMGSSLSLLPSFMHRLENLLVAIELKHLMISSFAEASHVRAESILEALTTDKCMERLSLERFEVLGDAFLKYIVGRHSFISFEGLDEGILTKRRSSIVNNLNLYDLAIKKDLQVFIRERFEPSQFFALGYPCTKICTKDNESILHPRNSETHPNINFGSPISENLKLTTGRRCTQGHRWLQRKTIADMMEALIGIFLVESGFKAAFAFLRWIGIEIDFDITDYRKACSLSCNNLSLMESMNIKALEGTIGHVFMFKGLLMEALIHPSYNKHSGGCYQRLEYLGDAVLEYLITSYLYSAYPDLKPGQITDLRSIAINNTSLAIVAIRRALHKHLIKNSDALTIAVTKFERYVGLLDSKKDLVEEPACPKVLGDIVESCVGAVLLDTGFDLDQVWSLMLDLLAPALSFSDMQIHPVRELRELCQSSNFELRLPDPVKNVELYNVNVEVRIPGSYLTFTAANRSSKAAQKMAAQKALLKLKALGYKHKNKSLEETLRTTIKKEAKLIGFDEEPLVIETYSSPIVDEFSKLSMKPEVEFISTSETADYCSSLNKSAAEGIADYNLRNMFRRERVAVVGRGGLNGTSDIQTYAGNLEEIGPTTCKTARSLLFEICAAYYWSNPIFECCKREGLDHLPTFTFKVTVQMQGSRPNSIECVGYPKAQKKAAQESAAEGAVWCLKHLGFRPNSKTQNIDL